VIARRAQTRLAPKSARRAPSALQGFRNSSRQCWRANKTWVSFRPFNSRQALLKQDGAIKAVLHP
jgi:hypothetical protein